MGTHLFDKNSRTMYSSVGLGWVGHIEGYKARMNYIQRLKEN